MTNQLNKLIIALLLIFSATLAYGADSFTSLRAEYNALSASAPRQSHISLGERFYKVYAAAPGAENADYALLYAGKSYKRSFEKYTQKADSDTAAKYFRILYVEDDYKGEAAAEAYLESAELYVLHRDLVSAEFVLKRLQTQYPLSDQATAAESLLSDLSTMAKNQRGNQGSTPLVTPPEVLRNPISQPSAGQTPMYSDPVDDIFTAPVSELASSQSQGKAQGPVEITDIRYYSGVEYTRVVIDMTNIAKFEDHWLKANPAAGLPPRLFIDIHDSTVKSGVPANATIKDGLLTAVRWGVNRPGVTRVVLDTDSVESFKVYQTPEPSRIVIDVTGKSKVASSGTRPATLPPVNPPVSTGTSGGDTTLARAMGLKVATIVIDAGHGGKDPGCVYHGLKEKDITLDIAKQLRDLINSKYKGMKVVLTRETDKFISLEERTAIANKHQADIFISIHINASKNAKATGIETYVLNITNDAGSLEVAAFENNASTKSISDLQGILNDIIQNSKLEESLILANYTQTSLIGAVSANKIRNLGVKQAPFYVLVGAQMPSTLVEAGFLSNKNEAKLLSTAAYRKKVASGVYKGLEQYIAKYNN